MTIVTDVYELGLATSGKLKLRATARLAEGGPGPTFDACVLLHEAARAERRAVEALAACSASTRLAASIEECWCLVEGLDPPRAAEAWGRVLRDKRRVDPATAAAMLDRLGPRFAESERRFEHVLTRAKNLAELRSTGSIVPATPAARSAVHRDVKRVLDAFPGATGFWWASYRLLVAQGDDEGAWRALGNARLLDPDNRRFEAMSLLLSARALPAKAADEHLARVRGSFDEVGAEVCLMYAHAEIQLAKTSRPEERWARGLDAANADRTRALSPRSPHLHPRHAGPRSELAARHRPALAGPRANPRRSPDPANAAGSEPHVTPDRERWWQRPFVWLGGIEIAAGLSRALPRPLRLPHLLAEGRRRLRLRPPPPAPALRREPRRPRA